MYITTISNGFISASHLGAGEGGGVRIGISRVDIYSIRLKFLCFGKRMIIIFFYFSCPSSFVHTLNLFLFEVIR